MNKKQIKLYKLTYNLTRYSDGEQIDFTKFNKLKINFHDYFGCYVNYNKLDNHNFIEDVDMFGAFAQYMGCKKAKDIIKKQIIDDEKSKQSEQYINLDNYKLKTNIVCGYSKLLSIERENSIYIPCYYISNELIEKDLNGNKILKIKFKIGNKSVIDYLTTKINKYHLLDGLNLQLIDKDLIKLKYKLEESKIYMPFDETNNNHDELEICSKIYNNDIDDFYSLNDFDILNTLNKNETINCLFDIGIFVRVLHTNNDKTIEYIDINLRPRYIYSKKE